jgi:hypothetical protein
MAAVARLRQSATAAVSGIIPRNSVCHFSELVLAEADSMLARVGGGNMLLEPLNPKFNSWASLRY